ncbi:TetR/AcrR family transcriptional regulator [Lichenifustis flavocetrariae]|uniref:TetR/AcrR family transcriptional regulator n=1 Tax=Lichenifustis flavocetrariae TaxID=2949735 RepID=A0AA41Z087_9HYPH|nr:TetR/AcrR family transcriptional regulator [Lichenifustis flavocetrariae]MCW6510378.1 TetR/AcrR family transcriptional regulator [Lichenifustis flavocetrariae]
MAISKSASQPPTLRADAMRRRVIEAAERLLRKGSAEFSMRELAAEAGVSFATPFNQFGSKVAIMHALSAQRIAAMAERFDEAKPEGDAADRVLVAVEFAAAVMLAEPQVNRAIIGTLGAPGGEPGQVYARSRALWTQALGDGNGLNPELIDLARSVLPDQLAVAFRGVLSFWTAGEVSDAELAARTRTAAAASLLGFVDGKRRVAMLALLSEIGD